MLEELFGSQEEGGDGTCWHQKSLTAVTFSSPENKANGKVGPELQAPICQQEAKMQQTNIYEVILHWLRLCQKEYRGIHCS